MINKKHILVAATLVFSINILTAMNQQPAQPAEKTQKESPQAKSVTNFLSRLFGQATNPEDKSDVTTSEELKKQLAESISSKDIINLLNIFINETKNLKTLITQFSNKEIDEKGFEENLEKILPNLLDSTSFKKIFNFLSSLTNLVEDEKETKKLVNAIPDLNFIIKNFQIFVSVAPILLPFIIAHYPELAGALTYFSMIKLPKIAALSKEIAEKIESAEHKEAQAEQKN